MTTETSQEAKHTPGGYDHRSGRIEEGPPEGYIPEDGAPVVYLPNTRGIATDDGVSCDFCEDETPATAGWDVPERGMSIGVMWVGACEKHRKAEVERARSALKKAGVA